MSRLKRTTRSARVLRARSGAAGGRAGFTLVEMLVAVGAVAFVAVGIASIFASVGDTVSRGRSVSAITQYAAVLERQMRADFEAMTREGYLIIRHELASDGMEVPLYPEQPTSQWRPRRIDEIMFFVDTPSRSAREAVVPGFVPEASSARVYYGMGQRLSEDLDPRSQYAQPDITDRNRTSGLEERLGFDDSPGATNPNRFARDWTLLRHETALVTPGGSLTDNPGLGVPVTVWQDNRLQIELQPAAESIFRAINELNYSGCPTFFPAVQTLRDDQGVSNRNVSALFQSGLVDVATTSLEEIRATVQSSPGLIDGGGTFGYLSPSRLTNCSLYTGLDTLVGPVGVQQAWMLNGMPAPSHHVGIDFDQSDAQAPGDEPRYFPDPVSEDERTRIRYEPEPPNLFDPFAETNAIEGAIRLADQYALASSGFIPRVTEFIVEWSFGKTDDDGQLIWHGGTREIDVDRDGTDDLFVYPYPAYQSDVRGAPGGPNDYAGAYFVPYRLADVPDSTTAGIGDTPRSFTGVPQLGDPQSSFVSGNFADRGSEYGSYPVYPEVIHGVTLTGLGTSSPNALSLVSYFGYTLPFFDPDDPDGDTNTPDAAASDTLDWPWPELIRVTVSLNDPGDETIERTFQYVFPTPGNPVR